MNRQLNLKIDIDSRKVTKYNDLIKVGDTVTLSITLTSKGNTVSLSGETVKLFLKKEDNKKVEQSVNVSGNTITCTLSAQATTKVGQVVGELTFTGSNTKLTSSSFIFNVEGSVSNEVLEQSKDDVEILNKITDSITKANNTVETYKNNINAVAGTTQAVAALTEMKGLLNKAETNNTNLTAANTQATKNIKALTELGDATDLAKDVETLKKQTLENNYTSIETDSVLTKLESVKDGFVDNMVIGGKTVQNLNSDSDKVFTHVSNTGNSNIATSLSIPKSRLLLKPSQVYTIVVDNDTALPSGVIVDIGTIHTSYDCFTSGYSGVINLGRNVITLTSREDFSVTNIGLRIFTVTRPGITATAGKKSTLKIMILEGDWTDKEIPSYFKGIKSVAEDEYADGKYPIMVESRNKNLLIYEPVTTYTGAGITYNLDNEGNIIANGTASATSTFRYNFRGNSGELFYLLKGTYTLSIDSDSFPTGVLEYVIMQNETFSISGRLRSGTSTTITITEDKANLFFYVAISSGTTVTDLKIPRPMLSISGDTTFKIPTNDTTKILLKEPLRGLPNGVKDTIDFEKGVITRNVGVMTLTGNESWISEGTGNGNFISMPSMPTKEIHSNSALICNNLPNNTIGASSTTNPIAIMATADSLARLRIKFKSTQCTVEEGRAWLKANPTTVYYQLATPTTEKLEIKDTLQTFKDGYIQLENSITPVVNLDFSTNYPSIVANLKEKLDALMDRMATVEAYITEKASVSIIENI